MANTKFTLEYDGTTYTVEDDIDRVRKDVDDAIAKDGGIVTIATTEDYEAESPKQIQVSKSSSVTITE
ncbi:hypothetical protein C5B96_08495 [Subtercola sp. Z020]|jgi:frataxin-like iron-binding protein CyaY|uniref:hypothetical protein n=1 Tax=Subtercola sp. Z020 TaxID=2080582 RepID=UPI000CE896D2|nr:hypothetical protein [Subtercola sp. Z020]PPF82966.1 hypothetical protein C5B96_08495 [Subtercola sp. Z020]